MVTTRREEHMPRTRVTITGVEDRREQLRIASRLRQELIDGLNVRLDHQHPLNGIHRDQLKQPYFEFDVNNVQQVKDFVHARQMEDRVFLYNPVEPLGEPCANCGNIAGPELPTVCPNCGFRDIARCPICETEIPRWEYRKISGSLFVCPNPLHGRFHRVRLTFNEPMFERDGSYREPLVVVSPVGEE
jgi:hypothetical protein